MWTIVVGNGETGDPFRGRDVSAAASLRKMIVQVLHKHADTLVDR